MRDLTRKTPPETLTDIEVGGLSSPYSLADGHAYQDLSDAYAPVVEGLADSWKRAQATPIPDMERRYVHTFGSVVGSKTLATLRNFKICPTASNSIDILGAFLATKGLRTGLIEPTFDNLALLLLRRGVDLPAIDDAALVKAIDADALGAFLAPFRVGGLFLVNPNNPTGRVLTRAQLDVVVNTCLRTNTTLLLDNSFRIHNRHAFDDYAVLLESGVSFVAFEDTGKTFPTLDMKASILAYSEDNKALVEEIYKEFYLCVSSFALDVLIGFLEATARHGLEDTVWKVVDEHRAQLRFAMSGTVLRVHPEALDSNLSVEWIDCSGTGLSDLELCALIQKSGLTLLPGRQFYWKNSALPAHHSNVRASLLKPKLAYRKALEILSAQLARSVLPSPPRLSSSFTDAP